jgi:hypothetical protein
MQVERRFGSCRATKQERPTVAPVSFWSAGVADAKSVATQSDTDTLERLVVFYRHRHKEASKRLGAAHEREASFYKAATQVFSFELARRGCAGGPDAVVTWESMASSSSTLEALRQEMQRAAARSPLELPAALPA